MTTPRLDAATLRWVADICASRAATPGCAPGYDVADESTREGVAQNRGASLGSCAESAYMAAWLRDDADRIEAAPPTLASWVAAAESSALGRPGYGINQHDGVDYLVLLWPGVAVDVSLALDGAVIDAEDITEVRTPAALTAALNAIAGSK